MNNYSKKMDRRDFILTLMLAHFSKLGRKYPFILSVFMKQNILDECGDKTIVVELLNDMKKKVIKYNNQIVETWASIKSLDAKGELLEDREKGYKETLFERLATLVGKDVADQWQIMSPDGRWDAIQNVCEKQNWQLRVKYDKDQWICVNSYGKILSQEKSFRRVVMMPYNALIRNPEIVTDGLEGKTRHELYALKSESLMQIQVMDKQKKMALHRLANITEAIARAESEEIHKKLGDGSENEDEDSDEDIRKLLRGD